MSEERLKDVNIYSFNDENYVSLQDYVKLQQRNYKAIEYINNNYLEPNEPNLLSILQGKEMK